MTQAQKDLIAQIEALRKFITDNLSLDTKQMAQSEYLLDYIKDNIEKTNTIIFQASIDDDIPYQLNLAQEELGRFNSNQDETYFQDYLKYLVNVIKIVPIPLRKGRDKQKDTLSSVASHADNLISDLDTKASDLENKITNLGQKVSQLQDSATKTITETNEKIKNYATTFETNSNKELEDFFTEQAEKITELVSKNQEVFSTLAAEKTKEIETLSSAKDKELTSLLTEQQNQLDQKQHKASKILDMLRKTLAESELKLKGINENYGLSGEKVLTGTYARQKDIERKQANHWRVFAFIFLCSSVVVAIFLHMDIEKTSDGFKVAMGEYSNGWQYFSKYGLVITLLLPGLLALRESAAHRQRSSQYTQLEAQLAALDPFIQNFEFKEDFKSELKEAFFPGYATVTDRKERKKGQRKTLFASLTKNSQALEALKTDHDETKSILSETTKSFSVALDKIEKLTSEE